MRAAEVYDRLQCSLPIPTHIDRSMEGHAHPTSCLDEPSHEWSIDLPLRGKATDDYSIYADASSLLDVVAHDLLLNRGVEEVPSTGANDDVELDV